MAEARRTQTSASCGPVTGKSLDFDMFFPNSKIPSKSENENVCMYVCVCVCVCVCERERERERETEYTRMLKNSGKEDKIQEIYSCGRIGDLNR
jgi:hypothetical protein